jgi:hypothetical protein
MADQESSLNGTAGPLHTLLDRSRAFVATIMDLASLQGELVVEDAHQAQVHLKQALAMGVVGAICALAAVPLFAAALVDALRTFADWSLWSSCLAVAALLTVLAVVFVGVAWKRATRAAESFATTRREAKANFLWLRETMSRTN